MTLLPLAPGPTTGAFASMLCEKLRPWIFLDLLKKPSKKYKNPKRPKRVRPKMTQKSPEKPNQVFASQKKTATLIVGVQGLKPVQSSS